MNAKSVRRSARAAGAFLACAAITAVMTTTAGTSASAKSKVRYVYVVSEIKAADSVKEAPSTLVAAGLSKGLTDAAEITGELPEGAPDPEKSPKEFKRYLKKKKLRAFRVNLEITAYDKTVEETERGFKRVGVHISIRLFGETMPDRVMAFAGSGSATVKLDVGKKVRTADTKAANAEAIQVAVNDAIAASLKKLAEPKRKKRKKRKRRSKK